MIDVSGLPQRVMLDSSVLTITRKDCDHEEAPTCRDLYEQLLKAGKIILLPTPAIAEYMSTPPHEPPPRQRGVEVIPFDDQAAAILGKRLPKRVFMKRKEPGATGAIVKYDTMVVACALRGLAGALISRDRGQLNLAKEVDLGAYRPTEIQPTQGDLFTLRHKATIPPIPPPADESGR
ncbi:hypothetical protein [Archangium sp.]|uniref:hypothetical protein n=1 Tax=Archangium sp. TaxID=1872627 RepID=UPI002D74DB72|nr:hypothetical protein [Archangium sp.]HYO59555.1 hypothetical protein [Archangium sp.]